MDWSSSGLQGQSIYVSLALVRVRTERLTSATRRVWGSLAARSSRYGTFGEARILKVCSCCGGCNRDVSSSFLRSPKRDRFSVELIGCRFVVSSHHDVEEGKSFFGHCYLSSTVADISLFSSLRGILSLPGAKSLNGSQPRSTLVCEFRYFPPPTQHLRVLILGFRSRSLTTDFERSSSTFALASWIRPSSKRRRFST